MKNFSEYYLDYHSLLSELKENENETIDEFRKRIDSEELKVWKEEIDSDFNLKLVEDWKSLIGSHDFDDDRFCFYDLAFEEIKEWFNIGFQPEESELVRSWKDSWHGSYGLDKFSLKDAKEWINAGLKKDDVDFAIWLKEFKNLTPEKYLKNIEKENYYKLKKEKVLLEKLSINADYKDLRDWLDLGFDFDEMKRWTDLDLSLEDFKLLKESVGYEKVKEWADLGLKLNLCKSLIYYWNKNGLSPKDQDIDELVEKEILMQDWLDTFYPENSNCLLIEDHWNYGNKVKDIFHLDLTMQDFFINFDGNFILNQFSNLNNLKCSEKQLIALIESGIENLPKSLEKIVINSVNYKGISNEHLKDSSNLEDALGDYSDMDDQYRGYEHSYSGTNILFQFKRWIEDRETSKLTDIDVLKILNNLLKRQIKLVRYSNFKSILIIEKKDDNFKENLSEVFEQHSIIN